MIRAETFKSFFAMLLQPTVYTILCSPILSPQTVRQVATPIETPRCLLAVQLSPKSAAEAEVLAFEALVTATQPPLTEQTVATFLKYVCKMLCKIHSSKGVAVGEKTPLRTSLNSGPTYVRTCSLMRNFYHSSYQSQSQSFISYHPTVRTFVLATGGVQCCDR